MPSKGREEVSLAIAGVCFFGSVVGDSNSTCVTVFSPVLLLRFFSAAVLLLLFCWLRSVGVSS